jgi:hypothetical protein
MIFNHLEESLRMFAHRTEFGRLLPFMGMTAFPASPEDFLFPGKESA